MHPGLTTRTAALLAAALAVASALGYWGVSTYRKSELQKAVTALVKDTSERLQAALAIETGTMPADQTVGRLDDHAQEVDKHVLELRDMSASPDRALVDAAEEYMLTVRQILRNQAASHRYRIQVSASDRALRDHMRAASRRRCAQRTAWKRTTPTTGSRPKRSAGCSSRIPMRERSSRCMSAGRCSPTKAPPPPPAGARSRARSASPARSRGRGSLPPCAEKERK